MRYAIFYMDGGLDGEGPEPVAEVGIDEEGAGHRGEREVAPFGDSILVGGVGNGFFVRDASFLAVGFELPFGEFGGVVDSEKGDAVTAEIFGDGTKFLEKIERLVTGFHKIKGYVTRIATYKENEVFKTTVAGR
jgi:hypothetical protein